VLDPVDLVVNDLHVGYYPNDIRASEYEQKSIKDHSYSHHLFIDCSLNHTIPDGYHIYIIAETLLTIDYYDSVHKFIRSYANIVGVIQLPETAFASKKHAKSILIMQKNCDSESVYQQPLLVKLPSLSNAEAMEDIFGQMNAWFEENFN